jgi:hypothetical protein
MKKSFLLLRRLTLSKLSVLPILMTFLFVAGMQVDMNAQQRTDGSNLPANAGNSTKTLYALPSGLFASPLVAQQRLDTAMKNLKTQLEQYPEGSAPYNAAYLRLRYYQAINENLVAGKGVAESIVAGLSAISVSADAASTVSSDTILAEKNAAIALLRP